MRYKSEHVDIECSIEVFILECCINPIFEYQEHSKKEYIIMRLYLLYEIGCDGYAYVAKQVSVFFSMKKLIGFKKESLALPSYNL